MKIDIIRKFFSGKRSGLKFGLFSMAAFLSLTSCNWVDESLEPCAPEPNTLTTVNFIYDYNMKRQDLLTDHVGSVYLYVFDDQGIFRFRREKHYIDMEKGHIDFSMNFDTTEIKPGRLYEFVAVAQGNRVGYYDSQKTHGFTLEAALEPGVSRVEDYVLKLDRDNDGNYDFGVINYKDDYGNNEQMIDTVWSTKPDEVQYYRVPQRQFIPTLHQQEDYRDTVVVPLMRITNSITVNLINPGFTENTNVNDYHILIDFPNGNGTIDFTGNTLPAQELYYQTLRKKVIPYVQKSNGQAYGSDNETKTRADEEKQQYEINATFGVSRLQTTDGSSLQVRDAETNEILIKIDDFAQFLADYFDHGFDDDQEFLDREYDYTVDIGVEDGRILWYQCGVSILGWGKRVYNYELQ